MIVAMKQTDHLRALGRSLREAVFPAVNGLDRSAHILVLDDEADDGSILDARVEASEDPIYGNLKQIPRAIADLWAPPLVESTPPNLYATYVGYTATPQANFLQEEHNPLAPREFVVSLRTPFDRGEIEPRSSTYFEPRGMESYYTGGEAYYRRGGAAGLCIATGNNHAEDQAEAIRAFLVAGAIRSLRASEPLGPWSASQLEFDTRNDVLDSVPPPHSMLVHPSALVDDHFSAAASILRWAGVRDLSAAKTLLESSAGYLPSTFAANVDAEEEKWRVWADRYQASANAIQSVFNTPTPAVIPDWVTIKQVLKSEVIPGTRVAVVNSDPAADDRPEYEPWEDENGKWHAPRDLSTIFVSGNVMARGLTLEGLTTTLFLRTSNQALSDSQMQMQRWFGYRGSYLELCRLFASQAQLDFFSAYHDVDEALREVITNAMAEGGGAPDPLVLQGRRFLATGKIANLGNQPLCPGPKPFIRLINEGHREDPNVRLLAELFSSNASSNVRASQRVRGRMLNQPLSLESAAELLDSLEFDGYRPGADNWQGKIWAQVQTRVQAEGSYGNSRDLYRPRVPEAGAASSEVRRDCPYALAAYFRLWSACLSRHVRGLFPTDGPLRQWSMVNLPLKNQQQPRFWVGIRYGSESAVSSGPLATLPFQIRAVNRRVVDGEIVATWGSRDPGAGETGFRGDEYLDYYFRSEPVPNQPSNEPPWRPVGSDGLILFYVNQPPGQPHPTVAVGVCIPVGGPEQFTAAVLPQPALALA
ncbi:Z1 domain-containing protein [Arthrobacter sp. MMS24-T111]